MNIGRDRDIDAILERARAEARAEAVAAVREAVAGLPVERVRGVAVDLPSPLRIKTFVGVVHVQALKVRVTDVMNETGDPAPYVEVRGLGHKALASDDSKIDRRTGKYWHGLPDEIAAVFFPELEG